MQGVGMYGMIEVPVKIDRNGTAWFQEVQGNKVVAFISPVHEIRSELRKVHVGQELILIYEGVLYVLSVLTISVEKERLFGVPAFQSAVRYNQKAGRYVTDAIPTQYQGVVNYALQVYGTNY